MKRYPFQTKSIEELVKEANELLRQPTRELTEEEQIEDDADGGYFQDEDD